MSGKFVLTGILGLVALCAGCTLPCHPFDYNGPVYDGAGQCVSNARAGSILDSGDTQPVSIMEDQEIIGETTTDAEQSTSMAGQYEGATQILSVTDRKVEDSETLAKEQVEENQSEPILAQPTSTKLRWH